MPTRAPRSGERLVFHYKRRDTVTSVRRATVRKAAQKLGVDETTFLHLAAASLIRSLNEGGGSRSVLPGDARLTEAQLAAIRSMEPQDVEPTRTFRALLDK
jgi:LmbE family N-acetylglucosaminyl deacetylase